MQHEPAAEADRPRSRVSAAFVHSQVFTLNCRGTSTKLTTFEQIKIGTKCLRTCNKQSDIKREIVYFDTRGQNGRLAHCKCKNAA